MPPEYVRAVRSAASPRWKRSSSSSARTRAARYRVQPVKDGDHVLVDMAPAGDGYAVGTHAEGNAVTVEVTRGGAFRPSAEGTLCFTVAPSGALGACAAPSPWALPSKVVALLAATAAE